MVVGWMKMIFLFQAEDGIRDKLVTGVQTCALPISPDLRADNARAALALPDLTADLRASLWAALFHNLVVAGRTGEALAIEGKAREAVYASRNRACWFAFELPESAVH